MILHILAAIGLVTLTTALVLLLHWLHDRTSEK
jgi:hypothetical protein